MYQEGDPALGLWLIERGSVKIFKVSVDGMEHTLHLLSEGNTFNGVASFDETSVWLIPLASLDAALASDPALARHVIRLLALCVRGLVHRFEDPTLYGVVVRLARFLLQQADDPADGLHRRRRQHRRPDQPAPDRQRRLLAHQV
ncbi:MAG TPA: Crp/Fnr family transcriptional regulator [Phototrophicaceae bacterium]|nr:Crp/Fnr family transcriptional regulator [Phototrophicaceae bacterium]